MFEKAVKCVLSVTRRHMSGITRSQVITPFQETSMNEKCIVVDELDKVLGSASKFDCHRIKSDGSLILHRAFSLFIFNSKGEMLVQQRSAKKVTFPCYVANACCSHPLHEIEEERNETDAVGVKLAARRRIDVELGIPKTEIDVNDFHYITRIIYRSDENNVWGEHELDYILFLKKDVNVLPNPEEVAHVEFVSQNDFESYLKNLKHPLSPWFRLIVNNFLQKWWSNLDNLDRVKDHSTIHKLN